MAVTQWMCWEGALHLAATTRPGFTEPNLVLHVARRVATPVGSAPAGWIEWSPEPGRPPALFGFLCMDALVGSYFAPKIWAGTPLEQAPVIPGQISFATKLPHAASTRVQVGGHVFEIALDALAPQQLVQRTAGHPMPFIQQGVEASAGTVALKVNGQSVTPTLPKLSGLGGPAATWSACGLFAR
ncbi:MAG: hypothetical protein O3A20_09285 [Planctomycetota bacterium]|nr:hypothetical protein [Planctomycetota bacterium]